MTATALADPTVAADAAALHAHLSPAAREVAEQVAADIVRACLAQTGGAQ